MWVWIGGVGGRLIGSPGGEEGEEDEEGEEEEGNLLLLHIWLGLATTVGCLLAGLITTSTSSEYFISRCFLSLSHVLLSETKKYHRKFYET